MLQMKTVPDTAPYLFLCLTCRLALLLDIWESSSLSIYLLYFIFMSVLKCNGRINISVFTALWLFMGA